MAAVLAGSGDGGSPHPDLRQRREERAFPLHVPLRREPAVPAGGRVGFRCSRNSLSQEACAGEKGGGGGRKEREAMFGLPGAFRKRRLRPRVDYGTFCKKGQRTPGNKQEGAEPETRTCEEGQSVFKKPDLSQSFQLQTPTPNLSALILFYCHNQSC